MSTQVLHATRDATRAIEVRLGQRLDLGLVAATIALVCIGLVMVGSASIGHAERVLGSPFHYFWRQAAFLGIGLVLAAAIYRIRLAHWENAGFAILVFTLFLLLLVLMPGIGKTVNGSTRWLGLGLFNVQVSEIAKLGIVLYLGGYLVRRGVEVRTRFIGFVKPLAVVALAAALLLMEPDFGAAAVLMAIALGMLFLAGSKLWQFALLIMPVIGAGALLAVMTPYRMARLTAFLNPWSDPYNSGFQLTQSLIAIGSGSFTGVGLGASVQKLFYLPEAHTDFLFAILAEELGLIGVVTVVALFGWFVLRCFRIGVAAEGAGQVFGASIAWGIGLWVGLQGFVNMGVNMGILPTKGLTLPFMSYGGSSLVIMMVSVGLLLRVHRETVEASGPRTSWTARPKAELIGAMRPVVARKRGGVR